MTKRSDLKPTRQENQADLFGAAPPPAAKTRHAAKTTRTPGKPQYIRHAPPTAPGALFNVRQAAVRLGLSKSTLDKMRGAGKGPRFIKSTDRAVRYDPADLDAWIEARKRGSTSKT